MPPQAKNTVTLIQYDPQKLTPKTQTGNIGIHSVAYLVHKRFGDSVSQFDSLLTMVSQPCQVGHALYNHGESALSSRTRSV